MSTKFKLVAVVSAAALALAFGIATTGMTAPAVAEEFPSKPIQFVVPYAPGGPLDGMARLLAEKVRPDLGTVIVENKPGAGGINRLQLGRPGSKRVNVPNVRTAHGG